MSATRAALARTYRPRRFSEMATQEHVSDTLRTAVARGRTAHAYLFCGPRGVGKTTAARVLAMALNCPARGSDGEPCGECESCERIWAGRTSLDVVEIDAASNRGVDDARDLRERAMYAPTEERRFKVYIIDEAHMLTREAWNALLKILEEPPPRVIFVFATTEPQKIQQAAPPILSRCQRFDFRRIAVADIIARLRTVLEGEGIEAGEDALLPIARRADGGMRDALSLLDQVLSFGEGRITGEDVRRVLGLIGDELYLELFEILVERHYGDVFRFVQRIIDEGYDLAEFYRGLADALRALLVASFDGADAVADIREDLRPAYAEVAGRFAPADLLRMLSVVAEMDSEGRLRKSTSPRTLLEAMLLRFAYLDRTVDLEALLGGAPPPPPAERGSPRRSPPPTPPEPAPPQPRNAAPRTRPEPDAPARPGGPAPSGGGDAGQALALLVSERRLPGGLGIFLKAAAVSEPNEGSVLIELPRGPAIDLLAEPDARAGVQRLLSERLGRSIELQIRAAGNAAPDAADRPAPAVRLTPERVRADLLSRLTGEQPALDRAVRAWDLEIVE